MDRQKRVMNSDCLHKSRYVLSRPESSNLTEMFLFKVVFLVILNYMAIFILMKC